MPHNTPQYSSADRQVLNMFKDEYRQKVDSKERDALLRSKIFPSMFNHWKTPPESLTEEEKSRRLKNLKRWIINNWRPYGKDEIGKRPRKLSYIDILCRTKPAEVDAEVMVILEEEELEETQQHVFQQRRRAAKRIYERMDDNGKQEIDAMVDAQAASGNPVAVRQRKAEKGAWKSARQWSRDAWLDMGVLSLTFIAYMMPKNRIAVDVCDDAARHVNAPQSFMKKHQKEVEDMRKIFIDYVKAVYPRNQAGDGGNRESADPDIQPAFIQPICNAGGPPSLAGIDVNALSKQNLVQVMRRYCSQQYTLASGGRYRRIPYARIEANPLAFIDSLYFPQTVTLKDPQNMQMKDIKTFLLHIKAREAEKGIREAFRFRKYWHRTELRDAAYAAGTSPSGQLLPAPNTESERAMGSGQSAGRPEIQPASSKHTAEGSAAGSKRRAAIGAAHSRRTTKPHGTVPNPKSGNTPIVIDQAEMSHLTALGIPTSVPINGPQDGQPMYYMPQAGAGLIFPDNIDPIIHQASGFDISDIIDPTIS